MSVTEQDRLNIDNVMRIKKLSPYGTWALMEL